MLFGSYLDGEAKDSVVSTFAALTVCTWTERRADDLHWEQQNWICSIGKLNFLSAFYSICAELQLLSSGLIFLDVAQSVHSKLIVLLIGTYHEIPVNVEGRLK